MTKTYISFTNWKACCCGRVLAILQLLVFSFKSTFSIALQHHNQYHRSDALERGVDKMKTKFVQWSVEYGDDAILWVDGNNLRGMGKFEWTPLEVQEKVASFCFDYNITKTIIVWDHGSCPFVCTREFPLNSLEFTSNFQLDMAILFSGLSKRADDVILQESQRLVSKQICCDWRSMAFVTSDCELNYKLRRLSSVWNPSNGKSGGDTHGDQSLLSTPLFCDSTRFLDLLRTSDSNSDWLIDKTNQDIKMSLLDVKKNLTLFHKQQRRGYNPRRERTWERVVQAETFRRSLCIQDVGASSPMQSTLHSTFANAFLIDLQSGGYITSSSSEKKTIDTFSALHYGDYQGPSRLDKQQKRSLTKYNRFLTGQVIVGRQKDRQVT
jgi:hypothetical protein